MTNLQDCLEEVIGQGPGYFIHSDAPGAYRPSQWEPAALLADIQRGSPGMLEDHAWTEWSTQRDGSRKCFIHYGVFGTSDGHREVPGYGHLRAFELSQKQAVSTTTSRVTMDQLGW